MSVFYSLQVLHMGTDLSLASLSSLDGNASENLDPLPRFKPPLKAAPLVPRKPPPTAPLFTPNEPLPPRPLKPPLPLVSENLPPLPLLAPAIILSSATTRDINTNDYH